MPFNQTTLAASTSSLFIPSFTLSFYLLSQSVHLIYVNQFESANNNNEFFFRKLKHTRDKKRDFNDSILELLCSPLFRADEMNKIYNTF